jgi:SAM-dependent methyltransferase
LHLQCHIGTDTLSLARLGAQMSGLDFSAASLVEARHLAERCGTSIDYVESDVYAAAEALPTGSFDLVYTGIGALCWLPSIDRWAYNVSTLLKPGGRLFLRDGHPMMMSINEDRHDALVVDRPYFEQPQPMSWNDDSTYVETSVRLKATQSYEWNHGLGEVISALLKHGLQITGLVEHQSIPWEALPGQMVCDEQEEWHLKDAQWRLPLSYTLQACKPKG